MEYFLARLFSIGQPQIRFVLSRKAWQRVSIVENNESVVKILPTDRIITGLIEKEYDVSFQVRKTVAEKLNHVASHLPNGMKLVLIEGYRPLKFQKASWDAKVAMLKHDHPDWTEERVHNQVRLVIAQPSPLANHNCGGAVDVTLAYADGSLLDMGTTYPVPGMGVEWYAKFKMFSSKITDEQKSNRKILRDAMQSAGFVWYPGEWWHYCYGDRMWAVYTNRKECFYGPVSHE